MSYVIILMSFYETAICLCLRIPQWILDGSFESMLKDGSEMQGSGRLEMSSTGWWSYVSRAFHNTS